MTTNRLPPTRLEALDLDRVSLARHGLVVLAAAIPLQRATVIGALGSVVSLTAVVVIPLALWAGWRGGARRSLTSTPLVFAVALGWWAGATYFWSVDPASTAGAFLRLLPIIAMAVAFLCLSSEPAFRRRLLRAYVTGSVVAGSLVIWQYLTTPTEQRFSVGADASINQVAFTLVLALVPTAYLLARHLASTRARPLHATQWQLLAYGGAYSIILTAILLSGSRSGALLSALATAGAFILVVFAARNPIVAAKGIASLVLLALALFSALSVTEARPFERLTTQGSDSISEEARVEILARAWTLSAERPLLGAGLETGVTFAANGYTEETRNPHNTHLQIFLETGVVGSVLWLLLILALLRAAWSRPPLERLMWTGQLAILLIGVGARGFVYGVPMWFLFGMVAAARREAP